MPDGVRVEKDWVALKLEGPFPFSLSGVLSSFLQPLATAEIPIFVVSTFDTDYVLMKRDKLEQAIKALGAAGHEMLPMPALCDCSPVFFGLLPCSEDVRISRREP